ncbi:hypothetical protein MYU51_004293 [Penicillium brevicompactum]|uniref:uncharacterized protein n=2 Tax=cellular organisms TaxID=131567 RepID=UPI0025423A03|nr:uncharacterized protein N7506_000541 [Penicillium brevicompactum]KAJ5347288.1 hypothetical protein N7506_000541 [Penicillium brevicompactum]
MSFNGVLRLGTPEAQDHLKLAKGDVDVSSTSREKAKALREELITAPLFTLGACESLESTAEDDGENQQSVQYGLLGLRLHGVNNLSEQDDLVYANVSAPWSAFICGSQGSGKSHTLSCLLENALITPPPAGNLASPLAGMVMHYDKFTAFSSTQLCEAAHLCSSGIPVRVLVSPTNYLTMKAAYEGLAGQSDMLTVEPLYLPQKDLNIGMMKSLMGVNNLAAQPLYLEVVMKILRGMAIANQGRSGFDYPQFKFLLQSEPFIQGQMVPLNMRLQVLESFFEPGSVPGAATTSILKENAKGLGSFPPGTLTIIDLSCPFVGSEDACALFNIALSLFLKKRHEAGRVIAMDEAHKFMESTSPEALELTETLLSVVRQQRHLGSRVLIATQEPTLAPSLLELCNVTIIHRFSSPAWYKTIKSHIAGAAENAHHELGCGPRDDVFHKIIRLATGEALVFCPTALLGVDKIEDDVNDKSSNDSFQELTLKARLNKSDTPSNAGSLGSTGKSTSPIIPSRRAIQLGPAHAHIRVRQRITVDGGRSVLQF